jgi:cytochrome c553
MISMTRLQLFGLSVAAAILATASVHAEGDKAIGRKLIYTCNGCHGVVGYENAYPRYPVPRLAGQNEQYIINALHGYKTGERTHPTMVAQAESLSDKDTGDIAAYLSSLAPATPALSDADKAKLASDLKEVSEKSPGGKKAAACFACHGADGNAIDPQYPRLAGQYNMYLQQALHEYKTGKRTNPIMKGFVAQLSDQDIEDIAAYYSTLPAKLNTPTKLSTLNGHIQGD